MRLGTLLAIVSAVLIIVNSSFSLILTLAGRLFVPGISSSLLLSLGTIGMLSGIIVLVSSFLTLKSRTAKKGSILIILFSAIGLVSGGGFIVGTILGIIGGVLVLTKK